jgi:cell wall-associated NlpC family hydrolase
VSAGREPQARRKQTRRIAPQAATCLLAATILVTVPAAAAQAAPSDPAQVEPADAAGTSKASKGSGASGKAAPAERPQISAATLRKVNAYRKYRRKVARQERQAKTAVRFARKQIGKPYRWGATGPDAYDCSGLVQKSWRKAGVRLPRVTYSQYDDVRRKVSMKKLRPGDLVFFHGRGHVGMYVSKNRFIHAPNSRKSIRINKLSGYRKRAFAGAVRPGAPGAKKFPESIVKLANELDEQDTSPERRPDSPAPPSTSDPRPVTPSETTGSEATGAEATDSETTISEAPDSEAPGSELPGSSADIPSTPRPVVEDVLPETASPREWATPDL